MWFEQPGPLTVQIYPGVLSKAIQLENKLGLEPGKHKGHHLLSNRRLQEGMYWLLRGHTELEARGLVGASFWNTYSMSAPVL